MHTHDIAILGSGFAGSLLARLLALRGLDVLLLEKGHHPRFALGESTTPLANLALERLAARFDLPDLRELSTWGRWKRGATSRELGVGLKRGFTFYSHPRGEPFQDVDGSARLLVAASPEDSLADTHWKRADLDHAFVQRAIDAGVTYVDRVKIEQVEDDGERIRLRGCRDGDDAENVWVAPFVVDATGAAGIAARALGAEDAPIRRSSSLISAHVRDLPSFVDLARAAGAPMPDGPYPDQRAAVHHLLDIGWAYVLPFDDATASVGLLIDAEHLPQTLSRATPRKLWRDLLSPYPTLAKQLADAHPVTPFTWTDRVQHRLTSAAGARWAALPHTFAFFDPMFSTGIAWSLLGVERLVDVLTENAPLDRYAALLDREADQIERLIDAAHLARADFELFTSTTFLYFAAVSFEELRLRLLPERVAEPAWGNFLGGVELAELFEEARRRLAARPDGASFGEWMRDKIALRNVVGLADPKRHGMYPVDLDVLLERCELLGLSRGELAELLPRLRGGAVEPGPVSLKKSASM